MRDLDRIDSDRGHAIVKLAKQAMHKDGNKPAFVEIVEMVPQIGLVIVGPSAALRRISFLHFVEVAPGRYLLALDQGYDFRNLEIALNDALEEVRADDQRDRELIEQLLGHIKELRKTDSVRMAEILFVRLGDQVRR